MGFTLDDFHEKTPERDLQKYYSQLYRTTVDQNRNQNYSIEVAVSSLFSRTRVPTNSHGNRTLALLDIDKIISLNQASLSERGERVKYMRMVSGLMQQGERTNNSPNRQIQQLVRLARLHYMSQNRDQNDSEEETVNP